MGTRRRDEGFTMIEVLVTTSLLGLMMAIAISGWSSWARSSAHSGTARELQSILRQTEERAVTEGRAMCVLFDSTANRYTVYRGVCGGSDLTRVLGPVATASTEVRIASPVFTSMAGTTTGVTFYARGTASPGTVRVTRSGSSKVYTLTVEGLTGRVSLS
jgi:type II secretion system protein H